MPLWPELVCLMGFQTEKRGSDVQENVKRFGARDLSRLGICSIAYSCIHSSIHDGIRRSSPQRGMTVGLGDSSTYDRE